MSGLSLILQYLGSCFGGKLSASECGPAWQFTAICVLVVAGVVLLVMLRLRAAKSRAGSGQ